MQAAVRTKLPYHRAPPGLAARIGASLPREEVPAFAAQARGRGSACRRSAWPGRGLAGALAGVALTVLVVGGQNDPTMAVIGSHIRSMQAEHLTDVLTSDQHTVKPWLSARLDVSPPVRDLKDAGFPLVGGRLDYVEGHPAAAVVYQRAKHVINLFAWASAASRMRRSARRRGRASMSSPGGTMASPITRCPMWRPISWRSSRGWWRRLGDSRAKGMVVDHHQ